MIICTFENGNTAKLRHIVVDCLVIRGRKILLCKRAAHLSNGGKYCLIGGYLNRDETLEEGAKREVFEETGYTVRLGKLLWINDSPVRPQEDKQNVAFVYVAYPLKKTGVPDNESQEVRWFDLDDLPPKSEFAFDHHEDILRYLKSK